MKEKVKLVQPDYENCIANLPNSILKKWGIPPMGKTLPLADAFLKKEYKNVVVLLLDGMGKSVLETALDEKGPFRKHLAGTYSSVFLSTTVAATTSAMSGLQPCEHSWLGWDCYYPQVDKNVTVFLNTVQGTKEPAAAYNVARAVAPFEDIVEKIRKAGGKAYWCTPFFEPYPKSIEEICARIKSLCRESGQKYIYGYWNEPDETLHRNGCGSRAVKETLQNIEAAVYALAQQLEDTLILVTADHGHIDTKYAVLQEYPKICECLIRLPSLEPRVLNFFIKEGKKELFKAEFQKEFGGEFLLMPVEEAIEKKLFGTGKPHKHFRSMLGDYLAIATGTLSIYFKEERWLTMHGSLTEEEMRIPLIAFDT